MTIGTLVAALAQDTTTSTGTGAITLANAVPVGAVQGSTTLATAVAPTAIFPVNNIFYYLTDGTNVEVGLGSLTSATNFTRDHVLFVSHAGVQDTSGTHVNFAAGTKQFFSNTNLFATTAALWQRFPNQVNGGDGGYTEDIMSGTFTGVLTTGATTANVVVRYKVLSSGLAVLQFPAATVNGVGVNLIMTGIPAFLSNVTTGSVPVLVQVNSVNTIGTMSMAGGASPTATGTATFSQYSGTAPFAQTAVWTTGQPNGLQASTVIYPLY